MNYIDGEQVIIHSLGDNKEYIGIIRGIISNCNDIVSYIVEVDIDDDYQYSARTMPEHCIKPMPEANEYKNHSACGVKKFIDNSSGNPNVTLGNSNYLTPEAPINSILDKYHNCTIGYNE
jgi:hypothetical protein